MGLKTLRLVCTIGRFLAITPSSLETKTEPFHQKIYNVVVFLSLICGLTTTIITNNYFLGDIYMKIVVSYLTEFNLIIFSFYVMVVINFKQRLCWYQLIRHIKTVKSKTKIPKSKARKFPYYSRFAIFCVLSLLCESLIDVRWGLFYGWQYLKKFNVRLVQIMFTNFYKFMLCVILNTLRVRYKRVRISLGGKNTIYELHKSVKILIQLRQTIDIFNEIFQFPIALIVGFTTFEILNYILFIIYVKIDFTIFESVTLAGLRLGPTVVWTTILLLLCDYVRQEGEKIVTVFHEMRLKNFKPELNELTEYVEENLPVLTAGYFQLGKPTILRVCATVTNFVIVVVQITNKT